MAPFSVVDLFFEERGAIIEQRATLCLCEKGRKEVVLQLTFGGGYIGKFIALFVYHLVDFKVHSTIGAYTSVT